MARERVTVRYDSAQLRVDQFFSELSPVHKTVCLALRRLLLEDSRVEETVKWGYPCYECGGKMAAIVPNKSHVNLQFFRGAELSDGWGLLQGTGPGLRHISFRRRADVLNPAVAEIIASAIALHLAGDAVLAG